MLFDVVDEGVLDLVWAVGLVREKRLGHSFGKFVPRLEIFKFDRVYSDQLLRSIILLLRVILRFLRGFVFLGVCFFVLGLRSVRLFNRILRSLFTLSNRSFRSGVLLLWLSLVFACLI